MESLSSDRHAARPRSGKEGRRS
ncbi:unnamed protein product [Leptidea sinapis]|uniref:Uncharacterized protein n=1 Tax=Leptidea sinapis TaxID=189913 RepID=A0A5E4Q8K8_9NEOP|nr:unnamed protein product [Leptidea sinapis]